MKLLINQQKLHEQLNLHLLDESIVKNMRQKRVERAEKKVSKAQSDLEKRKKEQKQKDFKNKLDKELDELHAKKKQGKKLTIMEFKKVIQVIYHNPPEYIVDSVPSINRVVRVLIFIGVPFAINPILGVIAWVIDKIIQEKVDEKQLQSYINQYKAELDYVKKKQKEQASSLSEDEKKCLKAYEQSLENAIFKLEDHKDKITAYKDKEPIKDKGDERGHSITPGGDDFGDMGMDDFNFDESFVPMTDSPKEEAKYLQMLGEAMNELEMLSEISKNPKSLIRDATKSVRKVDRKASRAVDGVADTAIDGHKKFELTKIQQDLVKGRIRLSTLIKVGGATAVIAAAFNPVVAFCTALVWLTRRNILTKARRSQYINELRAEIEILEEKIKDADSANDKAKKYQYMRLKKELERTLNRMQFKRLEVTTARD